MFGWLQTFKWQVLATVAGISTIVLATNLAFTTGRAIKAEKDAHKAHLDLNVANYNLDQCNASVNQLTVAMATQSDEIQRQADASANKLKAAQAAVAAAQSQAAKAKSKLQQIISEPIKGATQCERIDDIDSRFVDTLK